MKTFLNFYSPTATIKQSRESWNQSSNSKNVLLCHQTFPIWEKTSPIISALSCKSIQDQFARTCPFSQHTKVTFDMRVEQLKVLHTGMFLWLNSNIWCLFRYFVNRGLRCYKLKCYALNYELRIAKELNKKRTHGFGRNKYF